MKLYRISKLAKPFGITIGNRHVLATSDKEAIQQAAASPDCPICDVVRDDGKTVGSIL